MLTYASCPSCGEPRIGNLSFCRGCGLDLDKARRDQADLLSGDLGSATLRLRRVGQMAGAAILLGIVGMLAYVIVPYLAR